MVLTRSFGASTLEISVDCGGNGGKPTYIIR
jgi:hypothetical protein